LFPHLHTENFTELGKLNIPYGGSILSSNPIFNTAPAAYKNTARLKSGQNRPENNYIALLI